MRSHDVLLVNGDLNGELGRSKKGKEKIMGKMAVVRLIFVVQLNDLVIGVTIFEHKSQNT